MTEPKPPKRTRTHKPGDGMHLAGWSGTAGTIRPSLQRAHAASKKFRAGKALASRLDELLGPVGGEEEGD